MSAHPFVPALLLCAALAAGLAGPSSGEQPGASGSDGEAVDRLSRIEQAVAARDARVIPLLREWGAKDRNERVRERSVGGLAILGDQGAGSLVLDALSVDPSARVRRAAAEAAGVLPVRGRVDLVARALRRDTDSLVRAECARTLGRLGGPGASQALIVALLQDPSPEVRGLSAEALARLRVAEAADVLKALALSDPSILVRIYVVRALVDVAPAASGELFETVWSGASDPDLRVEAFRGLLQAPSRGRWEEAGLADADERVRFLAFQSWLSRGAPAGPRTAASPDIPLERFLTDPIPGIRELAKETLERWGFRVRPSALGYAVEP